jgi:hypothetical protein
MAEVATRGRINLPALGAVLVVLGFWIGGKFHQAGFILAAIPIGIWAWVSFANWRRERRAKRTPQEPRA